MKLSRILHLPRSLVRKCGYDVVRFAEVSSTANARRLRAIAQAQVDLVLDIGAAEGSFGQKLRQSGYKGQIISFEPLTEGYETLRRVASRDELWQTVHTAVGDYDGGALMHISGRRTSSSLLPMAERHVAAAPDSGYITSEQVPIKRLDTLMDDLAPGNRRFYIKIDVQGYERGVIDGAAETLATTEVIELEVSMTSLYEGSTLYAEMISLLASLDFSLISWQDVLTDPATGYVLQADCIFERSKNPQC